MCRKCPVLSLFRREDGNTLVPYTLHSYTSTATPFIFWELILCGSKDIQALLDPIGAIFGSRLNCPQGLRQQRRHRRGRPQGRGRQEEVQVLHGLRLGDPGAHR